MTTLLNTREAPPRYIPNDPRPSLIGLTREGLADALERAVRTTLADGIRTGDLMGADGEARGFRRVGTDGFRDAVLERLGG